MINLLDQCLGASHRSLAVDGVETIQPEHHMGSTYLFVLFYLLSLNTLFETLKVMRLNPRTVCRVHISVKVIVPIVILYHVGRFNFC